MQAVAKKKPERDFDREAKGWVVIAAIMVLFPVLFFFCVFFPIWVGWLPAFP